MSRAPLHRSPALLVCALILLTFAVGCSSNSVVGQRVGNFTAYYNTFYNAQSSFDEAMETARAREAPVVRTVFMPLFPEPAARTSNARFDNAIKKSADVLRDHGESKWADDALLLIGRTYFETRQFGGAQQKFREIIDEWPMTRGAPSPLADEARFWLARSYVEAEQFEQAARTIDAALADDEISERVRARLLLVKGQLHVQQGQWGQAADALALGLEGARDRELRARGYFLLGQVHDKRGAYDQALDAFAQVRRFRPDYLLEYAAEISRVRMLSATGLYDDALARTDEMIRDGKNYDFRNELRLLRGTILQSRGDYDDAFYAYDGLLYGDDPEPTSGALRGRIHYRLGTLYRDAYGDYLQAAAQLDTAGTKIGAGAESELKATGEAILNALQLKRGFTGYRTAFSDVRDADSLLYLGGLNDEAFATEVLRLREAEADRLEAEQRELQRRADQAAFEGNAVARTGAAATTVASAGDQRGFLNYEDPVRVQEAYAAFFDQWGERPLVDNWRRRAAISGAGRVELESSLAGFRGRGAAGARVLPQIDLSGIPRTEVARARVRSERASARYRVGTSLFLGLERPDSAAVWFRRIIDEDDTSSVAPRAFYALSQVQSALGDTVAARALTDELVARYPDTDLAQRLGAPRKTAPDSSAIFASRYADLRTRFATPSSLDSSAADAAWRAYLSLSIDAGADAVAPQALFAAATLWNARLDSAMQVATQPLPPTDSLYLAIGLIQAPDTTQTAEASTPTVQADTTEARQPMSMRMPSKPGEAVEEPLGEGNPVRAEEEADPVRVEPEPELVEPRDDAEVSDEVDESEGVAPLVAESKESTPGDVSPPEPVLSLLDLYRFIAQAYPRTPYADRSGRIVTAVTELIQQREAARVAAQAPPVEADESESVLPDDGLPVGEVGQQRR